MDKAFAAAEVTGMKLFFSFDMVSLEPRLEPSDIPALTVLSLLLSFCADRSTSRTLRAQTGSSTSI